MHLRTPVLEPHVVQIDGKPVRLDEKSTAYFVKVDQQPPRWIEVLHERERYELASGLDPKATHDIRVTREAEAFAGVHELFGVELGEGGKLLPVKPRTWRIEVVGDSISCGYGVAGKEPCPFTYPTERATSAYGARLGTLLDADVTTVCWSGRGVYRNYDGSTKGAMPELFETTLPATPSTPWAFKTPPPDAVIVNLGTNDLLGAGGRPLDLAAFQFAYVQLTRRLRDVYPGAWIFLSTSPMLRAEPAQIARRTLDKVLERRANEGENRMEVVVVDEHGGDGGNEEALHWGCDGHPDEEMNNRIAARLETAVRARLRK
jgi:lysophospholipase L1-like esterase